MVKLLEFPRPVKAPAGWDYDLEVGGVLIGTPAYMGQVHSAYAACLLETKLLLDAKGIPNGTMETTSESLIQRGRDRIAAQFLALPGATHLFFIDADIEWHPQDVLRLLTHDVDMICGLYPKKCDKPVEEWSLRELQEQIDWLNAHKRAALKGKPRPSADQAPLQPADWPFHPFCTDQGVSPRDIRTGRIQIASAPTGFLCIKRRVFERLAAEGVVKKIRAMQGISAEVLPHLYDYFPVEVDDENGVLWSEDYNFCRLWRQIGGKIWVDPTVKLKHIGYKTYVGDVASIFHEIESSDDGTSAA